MAFIKERYNKYNLDKRNKRINKLRDTNNFTQLYHKTTPEIAAAILSNQSFINGTSGTQGGGIYFTNNARATNVKAIGIGPTDNGVILQCSVILGNVMETGDVNLDMTFKEMINKNKDSILYTNSNLPRDKKDMTQTDIIQNNEYIVYSLDQIIVGSISEVTNSIDNKITNESKTIEGTTYTWNKIHTRAKIHKGLDNKDYTLVEPDFKAADKLKILKGQVNSLTRINENGISRMGRELPFVNQKKGEFVFITDNSERNVTKFNNHMNISGTPIKLVSINVNYFRGNETLNKILSNDNVINADLICFQESLKSSDSKLNKINEKFILFTEIGNDTELIQIWKNKDSKWVDTNIIEFNTDTFIPMIPNCKTKRTMPLISLKHNISKEHIKIGVVHLCGGGPDEKYHGTERMILKEKRLKNIKIKILEDMVSNNADIILGDFNSDLTNTNIDFLTTHGFTLKEANIWNNSPFEYLKEHNYTNVENNNPTSFYGGIPDMIWYNSRFNNKKVDHDIIKLHTKRTGKEKYDEKIHGSDHNGLYAKLTLDDPLNLSKKGKGSKKKKKKRKTKKTKKKPKKTKKKTKKTKQK